MKTVGGGTGGGRGGSGVGGGGGGEEWGRIMFDKIKNRNSLEGPPPVETKFSLKKDEENKKKITPCPVPTHSDVF